MATPASGTSSAVIDERRAQQLMERALTLAERGDQQAAVLSCRQAVSLAPESAQAYSMLGLLLERSGDTNGAIAAYEKVLQFAPDSLLERESLSRLRASVAQRRTVHEPLRNGPVTSDVASTPAAGGADSATTSAVLPSATVPEPVPVPVMPLSTTMPMPGIDSSRIGTAPAAGSSAASLQRLRQRPSLYFRGAPLAAITALSLVFLLWAQSYSASRRLAQRPAAGTVVGMPAESPIFAPEQPPAGNATENRNAGNRVAGGSTAVPVNPTTSPAPGSAVAGTTVKAAAPPTSTPVTAAANAEANASAPRTGAATTPAARADEDGGRLTTPPAPVRASARPGDNQGAAQSGAQPGARATGGSEAVGSSMSGAPLGPGSTPGRSYVRVTPSGTNPVARPENRAANDERAAGNEAQSGRPSAAIERITQAIESGGPDVALRFQQRAQLYLQSGDAQRAISDFQAAIAAYNDMLAREDRVTIARTGITACRRGIQMAQARLQQQ